MLLRGVGNLPELLGQRPQCQAFEVAGDQSHTLLQGHPNQASGMAEPYFHPSLSQTHTFREESEAPRVPYLVILKQSTELF